MANEAECGCALELPPDAGNALECWSVFPCTQLPRLSSHSPRGGGLRGGVLSGGFPGNAAWITARAHLAPGWARARVAYWGTRAWGHCSGTPPRFRVCFFRSAFSVIRFYSPPSFLRLCPQIPQSSTRPTCRSIPSPSCPLSPRTLPSPPPCSRKSSCCGRVGVERRLHRQPQGLRATR